MAGEHVAFAASAHDDIARRYGGRPLYRPDSVFLEPLVLLSHLATATSGAAGGGGCEPRRGHALRGSRFSAVPRDSLGQSSGVRHAALRRVGRSGPDRATG